MLWVIIMNFCFMCGVPLVKQAIMYGHPLLVVAVRMIISGICIWGLSLNRLRTVQRPLIQWNWQFLLCVSLITIYTVNVGEAFALKHISGVEASLLWALVPMATAVIGCAWYKYHVRWFQWIGIGLCTIGMITLIIEQLLDLQVAALQSIWFMGILQMVAAVLAASWGYFMLYRLASEGYGMRGIAAIMAIGGVLSLITWLFVRDSTIPALSNGTLFMLYTLLAAIIVNGGALLLQSWLITQYSPIVLALSGFVGPIGSALLSVLLLGEKWHMEYGLSLVCMILGMSIFYARELRLLLI